MSDAHNDPEEFPINDIDRPVEEEEFELEGIPRRDKSAEFDVVDGAGAEAEMRRAMDPANQSLADALRLSYRILQLVIIGLAVVFVFSGFQTVAENHTGVRTLFGAIEGDGDSAQLEPGLQPFWPYPVGEIITVPLKRNIRVDNAFWPKLPPGDITIEQATNSADSNKPIRPGYDGSLMLRNGDLAHARIEAEYEIDNAESFLDRFSAEQADEVVRLSLERAAVQIAAGKTFENFIEDPKVSTNQIEVVAQAMLDDIDSGIRLVKVTVPDSIAPLAVRKAFQGVQESRERAKTALEIARSDSATLIAEAVGSTAFEDLMKLINEYELELSRGDNAAAEASLAKINARFEADDIGGDAAQLITQARTYRSMIESTLGNDARRLAGLVPSFRENPKQLVRQLWLETYQSILNGTEVEVFSAPPGVGGLALRVSSSQEVSTARRDAAVERSKLDQNQNLFSEGAWQLGSRQITIGKAGRRLNKEASGGYGRKEQ